MHTRPVDPAQRSMMKTCQGVHAYKGILYIGLNGPRISGTVPDFRSMVPGP